MLCQVDSSKWTIHQKTGQVSLSTKAPHNIQYRIVPTGFRSVDQHNHVLQSIGVYCLILDICDLILDVYCRHKTRIDNVSICYKIWYFFL